MSATQCPSCGATVEITNRFSKVLVCQYCGTHLHAQGDTLEAGKSYPKLADFPSIFRVGSTGTILGKPFRALGRLRYGYDGGHYDEWFIEYDGGEAWFAEDDGTFKLYTETMGFVDLGDRSQLSAGQNLTIGDTRMMIQEIGDATVQGGEGELGFYIEPGTNVTYIDGITNEGIISIEFTEKELEIFNGRPLRRSDIEVSNG